MPVIDDLVSEIDVDNAFRSVLRRHHNELARRRTGRVVLVAAVAVVLASVGWKVLDGEPDDQTLQVVDDPAHLDATPASQTVDVGDGVSVTFAVDDDRIAVGDSVEIEVTIVNDGPATLYGAWSQPVECRWNTGIVVRAVHTDRALAVGTLDHGDNGWFGPRDAIAKLVAGQVDGVAGLQPQSWRLGQPGPVMAGVSTEALSMSSPCVDEPPVEALEPGQRFTTTATWHSWIGPGVLPADGTFHIEPYVTAFSCDGCVDNVVLPSKFCATCAETELGGHLPDEERRIPIWVDTSTATSPPSAEQLVRAVERDDVQAALDAIGPRLDAGSSPVFGGWLLQIDHRWLQRIQGGEGAVDIWFDGAGEVLEVQHQPPEGLVTPPG